jgi:hypothetical protein
MRMHSLFWPAMIILAGVLMLLNAVLPWHLPVWRILLAVALICVGINMVTGGSLFSGHRSGISEVVVDADAQQEKHDYVFSSNTLDLRLQDSLPSVITLDCAFSNNTVYLPVDYSITIKLDCAFANITMPNGQSLLFGENTYTCGSLDPAAPSLLIKADCAFGSMKFILG